MNRKPLKTWQQYYVLIANLLWMIIVLVVLTQLCVPFGNDTTYVGR